MYPGFGRWQVPISVGSVPWQGLLWWTPGWGLQGLDGSCPSGETGLGDGDAAGWFTSWSRESLFWSVQLWVHLQAGLLGNGQARMCSPLHAR